MHGIADMIMIMILIIFVHSGFSHIGGAIVHFTPGTDTDTHTTHTMTTDIRHTITMAITNRAHIIRILPLWKAHILRNSIPQVARKTPQLPTIGAIKFLTSARYAFRNGDYSDALRLASHAAVELPKDAKAHELMSLALFALKDYKGANLEAHEALSIGPPSDWNALYAYYNDLPTYTKQLEALVDYIKNNKDAMDARFVLSYQDIMMGHKDAAKSQLEDVVAKIPNDQVAVRLLKDLGGSTPATIANPTQASPPAKHSDTVGEMK